MGVLLAEDDDDTAEFVRRGLTELGHLMTRERSGEDALHAGATGQFDFFVLDRRFDPQTTIVETHLSRLRAKLNHGFDFDPIETLRGVGYRMRGHG